jgi:hypothetical protein
MRAWPHPDVLAYPFFTGPILLLLTTIAALFTSLSVVGAARALRQV